MTRADARREDGAPTGTGRTVPAAAGIEKAYRRGVWPARRRLEVRPARRRLEVLSPG